MPNVMAAQPNIGGALCESSVIPFLVPRRKVWLTPAAGLPYSNAANIGERKTRTYNSTTCLPNPFVYIRLWLQEACTENFVKFRGAVLRLASGHRPT